MAISDRIAPLSIREKVGYGLGDMASNFYNGFFGIFLLYYYTDVWGISPAAAGTMFLVTKILDAVTDPAMGLIADRTQTRWGKYRPYLLWMAIPYALLGYLLFLGPDLSDIGKLIFAYVSYSLVMLAFTAINVPYSALLAVIHPKTEEREKATQYRFIFASLGTLTVGAMTKPLVEFLGQGDELTGFRLTIILFAVLSIIFFMITFASTKERIKPKREGGSISRDFGVLLNNISWIVLAISGILIVVGLIARISSAAFYMKYYVPSGEGAGLWWMDRTSLLITLGFVGQLFGAMLTPTFLKVFDKRQLMIFMAVLNAALLFGCYFVPPEWYWSITAFHTASIFTFGVMITLLFAMYTDCAEYGEWKSGINSAGLTVSASMFSLKTGSAVGSAVPAFILAGFGFIANEVQTPEAITGIRLMFNIVPALFFGAAGLLIVFYKLNGDTVKTIERELLIRRGEIAA
ncbi:MFS transporter [Litorimonas sp. WD9-15]|uniref:MFS transporter n=1 Tax=Litorimonas sp. WD9-15 TaxID=3418716 RepID=UPI003D061DF4